MTIHYLDNSGFCVLMDHTTLIFDYYNDKTDGARTLENGVIDKETLKKHDATYVFFSHSHFDHFNRRVLEFKKENSHIKYIFDDGILKTGRKGLTDTAFLKEGEEYSDENIWVKAFGSTDIGGSFMVKAEGLTIFHAGDLNFWHWENEANESFIAKAKRDFLNKLEPIIADDYNISVMFFPVDYRMGENGDLGAFHMIETFAPQVFIPMHFQNKFDRIEAFKAKSETQNTIIWDIKRRGDILTLV